MMESIGSQPLPSIEEDVVIIGQAGSFQSKKRNRELTGVQGTMAPRAQPTADMAGIDHLVSRDAMVSFLAKMQAALDNQE